MPEPLYDVHMVSFKRRGESAYNCLHRGGHVETWQYEALKRFMDEIATQPVDGAEDLA